MLTVYACISAKDLQERYEQHTMKLHRKDVEMLLLVALLRSLDADEVVAAADLSRSLNLRDSRIRSPTVPAPQI